MTTPLPPLLWSKLLELMEDQSNFTYCMLTPINNLCTFTHSKYDIVSHVPRPPLFVFLLFGLGSVSYIEGEKMGKAWEHMRWTRGGRRGDSAQLQMHVY